MGTIALQLYSIDGVEDDTATKIEAVSKAGFDGVEFAGVDGADDNVAAALEETDTEAPSAHVGLEELEADPEGVVERYGRFGVSEFVVPYLPPERFESREAIEGTADRLSTVAADLPTGTRLHYHNHDHEFVEVDGEPALTALLSLTDDLLLEPDLGWIGAAGHDPVAFLKDHADRISLVHVKDYEEGDGPVEGGAGNLDLNAVADVADREGMEWLIYEHEERQDSYETVRNGAGYLAPYR